MILQSFENPVWTVIEVGGIYVAIFVIVLLVVYSFLASLIEAIKDIVKFLKSKI